MKGRRRSAGVNCPDDFPIHMPGGGEVQSVIEQDDAIVVSLSYEEDFSTIADYFQDWINDNDMEVVNRFESSDPQSITWSVEDGDRATTSQPPALETQCR
ncbi:MAG: hypothetical protein ACLFWH_14475 [Actinomycetota bacterium]